MNKKGFTFIETIITTVMLSTALILLYNSYSNIISNEENRIYYNDMSDLYKTYYLSKLVRQLDDPFPSENSKLAGFAYISGNSICQEGTSNTTDNCKNINEFLGSIVGNDSIYNTKRILIFNKNIFYETNKNKFFNSLGIFNFINVNRFKKYFNSLEPLINDNEYYLVVIFDYTNKDTSNTTTDVKKKIETYASIKWSC